MRLSRLFGRTQREVPADTDTISHQLMLRAGLIQQLAAGVYSLLPLALRVEQKIGQIIREEMDAAGGQELLMPVVQPIELWRESGRDAVMGDVLFRLRDRRERLMCLGPTHEEVITDLGAAHGTELSGLAVAAVPDSDQVSRRATLPRGSDPRARILDEGLVLVRHR